MDVSIIIVNYNTRELTHQCLSSIFQQTRNVDFEVIVVDNNSKDGSQQMLKKQFPQVLLIENDENVGFGRANNIGIKHTIGKYLFLLNSDTILLNNAIKIFFDFAEKHNELKIGVIGSVLFCQNKTVTNSSDLFPSKKNIIKEILMSYIIKNYFHNKLKIEINSYKIDKPFFEVDYVSGADLFILKSVMTEFEGFDPQYFMYFEETDLQFRMGKKGYKRIIIKSPRIIHFQGGSNQKPSYTKESRIIYIKSMFYYFKKHSNIIMYYLFRLSFFIIRLPLLLDCRISIKERIQYLRFLLIE